MKNNTNLKKLHKHPYPSTYRTDNNRKQTKGRIKMGARVQSIPVYNEKPLKTANGNVYSPLAKVIGYIHQYHSNRL